jgi:hypothetical protein
MGRPDGVNHSLSKERVIDRTNRIIVVLAAFVGAAVLCLPKSLEARPSGSRRSAAKERWSEAIPRPKATCLRLGAPSARRSWTGCAAIRKSSSKCIT